MLLSLGKRDKDQEAPILIHQLLDKTDSRFACMHAVTLGLDQGGQSLLSAGQVGVLGTELYLLSVTALRAPLALHRTP